jgi:hypothetical protein
LQKSIVDPIGDGNRRHGALLQEPDLSRFSIILTYVQTSATDQAALE